MRIMILWTLIIPGPQPYIVARDLTHTQCRQMINDMKLPVARDQIQRFRPKPICKPQNR